MSGLFGIVSTGNCSETLFYGTDYHSHMGTEMSGLVVVGNRIHRRIRDIRLTQFKSKFANEYKSMTGRIGIGVISDFDPQPILISTHFGEFAVATMGRILNAEDLVRELHKRGTAFSEISEAGINRTEIVARLIATGENPVDGIERALAGHSTVGRSQGGGPSAHRGDRTGTTPGRRDDTSHQVVAQHHHARYLTGQAGVTAFESKLAIVRATRTPRSWRVYWCGLNIRAEMRH